jgi:hypothetical protein
MNTAECANPGFEPACRCAIDGGAQVIGLTPQQFNACIDWNDDPHDPLDYREHDPRYNFGYHGRRFDFSRG